MQAVGQLWHGKGSLPICPLSYNVVTCHVYAKAVLFLSRKRATYGGRCCSLLRPRIGYTSRTPIQGSTTTAVQSLLTKLSQIKQMCYHNLSDKHPTSISKVESHFAINQSSTKMITHLLCHQTYTVCGHRNKTQLIYFHKTFFQRFSRQC